jgi:hypothetical protein
MNRLKLILVVTILLAAIGPPFTKAQNARQERVTPKGEVTNAMQARWLALSSLQGQYYELRCRGGGILVGSGQGFPAAKKLIFSITEGETREGTSERMMNMQVNFFPAAEPVDMTGNNLNVGECSWVDRPFRPDEPFMLIQQIVYFGQKQALHGSPLDDSPTAAERFPDSQNVPKYMSDSNHYWSFLVRNTGNGYFEAKTGHYWKPTKLIPDVNKAGSDAKAVPTTGSRKATVAGADELNPQPLPPCEKCPQIKKVPPAQQKKIFKKQPNQD